MMGYSNYPRGSEWRKWDLHIHTPLSIIQQYGGDQEDIWEKFIIELENLSNEVKVIGINDYYFIDGYEKVMSYRKNGRLENIEKIFPLLEFRIDTFASATHTKISKINLHVLFDIDETKLADEIRQIKEEFIGHIKLSSKHTTERLTKENLIKYSSDKTLKTGFSEFVPSTQEIIKLIQAEKWQDKTVMLLGYSEWNNLEKVTQLKNEKSYLYNCANAFFTASENDDTTKKEEVLSSMANRKATKPLLHSLDIHKFEFLEKENYKCFTWIKADPTFNGLKQIIYEPQDRVKIQEEEPEQKQTYSFIKEVRFLDERSRSEFSTDSICLNSNLNSIIGGKSSGKSLLLYHIAKTLARERLEEIQNDDSNYKLKYDFEDDPKFDFEVKWADGEVYNLKDNKKAIRPITYIPQLYLNRLAEDQKHELNDIVEKMLKDNHESYKKFREGVFTKIESLNINISGKIQTFCNNRIRLSDKKRELKDLGDKKAIKKNLKNINSKIRKLRTESKFTKSEENKYKKLITTKDNIENKLDETDELIKILIDLKERLVDYGNSIEKYFTNLFQESESENNNRIVKAILKPIKKKLKQTLDDEIKKSFSGITECRDNSSKMKSELKKVKNQLQPLDAKITSKERFEANQKLKTEEKKKIRDIQLKESEIKRLESNISPEEFKEQYELLFNEYKNIVEKNEEYKIIKGAEELALESKIKFHDENFKYNFIEKIDKRRTLKQVFGSMFDEENNFQYDDKAHIECIFSILQKITNEEVRDEKVKFKTDVTEEQVLDSLFSDCFSIDYDLIQNGDSLLKMSPGKKGIVLFQLFLHLSKSTDPILIDQPEDNLDNRTVYQELNNFIKSKKIQRQIIIVSHNPNLVVLTDSENVIVANQNGQNESAKNKEHKFEYVSGSIEHSFKNKNKNEKGVLFQGGIRQHVCDILEGGEEAFVKRENKYGFKKISTHLHK